MAQVAIFKEIFDQVRKDWNANPILYSELKRHNFHAIFSILIIAMLKTITPC